jgi:hypothetical protein
MLAEIILWYLWLCALSTGLLVCLIAWELKGPHEDE